MSEDPYKSEKREILFGLVIAGIILVVIGNLAYWIHLQTKARRPMVPVRIPMGRPLEATPH